MREEPRATLLAVADGVAGQAGGEIASAAAVEALAQKFFSAPRNTLPADALGAAMRETNDAVLGAAGTSGQAGAASTLVAAVVLKSEAVIANLGDSRAYLIRDGKTRLLTSDHSGPAPSSVTRFVGDPRGAQPDVFVEELEPGDRLLLCSDGLTRHVGDDEIASLAAGRDLERSADALVARARERGGEDNITVVLHATPGRMGVTDFRGSLVSAILAMLAVVVVALVIVALIVASGLTTGR